MKSRLKDITNMIEEDYLEIWDTCCDHGKLGISLIEETTTDKIHFVDCVPTIIDTLKIKLEKRGILPSNRVELHLKKAEDIKLSANKSLICICGVGGVTGIDIVAGLLKNNNLLQHDILLCVQYKVPRLRKFLKDSGFKIKSEMLCFEGKWAHEIIKISLQEGYEIDLIGTPMYNKKDKRHLNFISKSIKHYEKKCLTNSRYLEILDLYRGI